MKVSRSARLASLLYGLSAVAMGAFVYLFVMRNAPGLTRLPAVALLGLVYVALYLAAHPRLAGGRLALVPPVARVIIAVALLALPLVFLNATVWDYYQPLSLFDDAIFALALSWVLLLAALICALWGGPASLAPAACVALLGPLFIAAVHQLSDPRPNPELAMHLDLFKGGEDGYDIYRIPGLLVLPAGSRLADGSVLAADRILALAEARRDGALDTGAIDLVQKLSDDGGATWSAQQLVCTYRRGEERGKCGNATPLFDRERGRVWLAYNLSGIPGDLPEGPRPHSAHLMYSDDGGLSWSDPVDLPQDNLVFGPGHGIQKQLAPARGRLLLPAYRAGTALVLYSDDHGGNWRDGGELGVGNESEVAELSDGQLYLASRHVAPIGRPPQPNGRLYALSGDGGESWQAAAVDTALPTPICQASVLNFGWGGLLFSNPADEKARVNMTIRASDDDGASWPRSLQVYPGPAGYSELGLLSGGDVILLYERGRMAYSEKISFARVPGEVLLP